MAHLSGRQRALAALGIIAVGFGLHGIVAVLPLFLEDFAGALKQLAGFWLHLGGIVLLVTVIDGIWMPEMNWPDLVQGKGAFKDMTDERRKEYRRYYVWILCALIVAGAWAG